MSAGRSSRSSGAAAFAVVLVTVLVWWLLSGNGPDGPAGNADRLTMAEEPAPGSPAVPAAPPARDDRRVRIDGYALEAPDRLALNYTTGIAACAGRLSTPTVVEDPGGVTITLATDPPAHPGRACIERVVLRTVRVTLESPLGGRGVLDGSADPRVRVERVPRPYEEAAGTRSSAVLG